MGESEHEGILCKSRYSSILLSTLLLYPSIKLKDTNLNDNADILVRDPQGPPLLLWHVRNELHVEEPGSSLHAWHDDHQRARVPRLGSEGIEAQAIGWKEAITLRSKTESSQFR